MRFAGKGPNQIRKYPNGGPAAIWRREMPDFFVSRTAQAKGGQFPFAASFNA